MPRRRIETDAEKADALARGKATSAVIGTKAMGTRFNVLMTIQVPLEQQVSTFRPSNFAGFGAHWLTSTETETSDQNQTNTKEKSRNHIEFDEKGQKVYNCSHCDKSYNSHHRWKLHEKLHTDPNLFSCKRCDFVARTWQIMKKHELAEHDSREKQYSCRFCPKTFMKFNSVKPHERTHTGKVIVHNSWYFYETEIEIWAGFELVGNTEKKSGPIMTNF